jgi:hypothetical protein
MLRTKIVIVTLGLLLAPAMACSKKSSGASDKNKPAKTKYSNRLLAWSLGSKLSLAALAHSSGKVSQARIDRMMKQCRILAKALGTEIPPLPARGAKRAANDAATLHYVLKTAGNPIGSHLLKSHGPEHAALFELAMKSQLLYLIYLPSESKKGLSATLRQVIEKRARKAGLPEKYYKPLTDKMKAGASFNQVTGAVSRMHREVKAHLQKG